MLLQWCLPTNKNSSLFRINDSSKQITPTVYRNLTLPSLSGSLPQFHFASSWFDFADQSYFLQRTWFSSYCSLEESQPKGIPQPLLLSPYPQKQCTVCSPRTCINENSENIIEKQKQNQVKEYCTQKKIQMVRTARKQYALTLAVSNIQALTSSLKFKV